MESNETYRPAFTDPPGTNLAGIPISNLDLPTPYISVGLPYDAACARHVKETFKAQRAYIVSSRSLASSTDKAERLGAAIRKAKVEVVGVRNGITPHTPWSEILDIAADCKRTNADCLVTLGAGSTTDGCKLVVLVSIMAVGQHCRRGRLIMISASRTTSPHLSSLRNTR